MNLMQRTMLAFFLSLPLHGLAQDTQEIRFAKGATSGAVRGEVSALIKSYTFRARQGQTLFASLTPADGDKGMLTMSIASYCGEQYGAPLVDHVLRWQGRLPCSDRFSIDVIPSEDARAAKRVQRYTLTLTIR